MRYVLPPFNFLPMSFFSYIDQYSDITDVLLRDQKRFAHTDAFTDMVLRGPSPFSVGDREMMAAYVSGLNDCQHCHGIHAATAERFGIHPDIFQALLEDIDTAPIKEELKPIFHYIQKLTVTPSKMVEADAQKVYAAGWSEQALYDAVCICSIFNFYNRLVEGHGLKGNQKIFEMGSGHLSKRGYRFPWFINLIKGQIRKSRLKSLEGHQE